MLDDNKSIWIALTTIYGIGRAKSRKILDQIKIAYRLFDAVNLNFICIGITIRIFNPDRKQYDVLETIPFLSEIEPEKEQLILF